MIFFVSPRPFKMNTSDPLSPGERNPLIILFSLLVNILLLASPSLAEWQFSGEGTFYYTDDAALFSATRRLARHQDPTQPVIDSKLANQGNDVVFEPVAQIVKSFSLMGRHTQLAVRGQGFVFTDNTQFNHGSLGIQANHDLTPSTSLILRYFFGPDLFLGKKMKFAPLRRQVAIFRS